MTETELYLERLGMIISPLVEAMQSIAAALEILASPIKRDNERRAAAEERERQLRASQPSYQHSEAVA